MTQSERRYYERIEADATRRLDEEHASLTREERLELAECRAWARRKLRHADTTAGATQPGALTTRGT